MPLFLPITSVGLDKKMLESSMPIRKCKALGGVQLMPAGEAATTMSERALTSVTWNDDISRVIGAPADDAPHAAAAMWAMVQRSVFSSRAEPHAAELVRTAPEAIALRDAFRRSVTARAAPQPGFARA
jgi:hypothetical protein